MIEVRDLTKYYGPFMGIEDVSFSVAQGEIVGFLGPNGAGKTTAMRILAGYMPATRGTASIAGFDVFRDSLQVRKRVGYMPETVPLYLDMAVHTYLDFFAALKGVPGKKKRERVEEVIDICRIRGREDMLIGKLSKGFRQRVGLAQALLGNPPVLILDEPTIGLDPEEQVAIRRLIKELGKDHTVLLSTHILPEVSATCGHVIIIDEGHIVAMDTPENLNTRLRGTERIQVEVRGPVNRVLTSLMQVPGVAAITHQEVDGRVRCTVECVGSQDPRAAIAAAIVQQGWALLELRAVGMTLEEIFLRLVTKEEAA